MLPTPPDYIAVLLQRPVAVFGAGVSGQGVLALLTKIGGVGQLYDEKAAGAENRFKPEMAGRHGLVVFSPGFAPDHAWLETARKAGCLCMGELDFASLFWSGQIMAITGTNGKTTLTEFLALALTEAGRPACVTGNVGYSFSRFVLEQTGRVRVAVCEVSSFQAETLQELTPTATFWTNFAEDHLERHPGMAAYFAAKARLVERTPVGHTWVGPTVAEFAHAQGYSLNGAKVVSMEPTEPDPQLAGTVFASKPQWENFRLAAAWWEQAGLPLATLYAVARRFRLGGHRLGKVGERRGVSFWNDSKATNFHAVEAALATFDRPVHWIGGGRAKGGDLRAFVGRIAPRVGHAYLIGETQPVLAGYFHDHQVALSACGSLEEAVRGAFGRAASGDHVLLSPGFASFDMFRGYDDRGRQFQAIVENL